MAPNIEGNNPPADGTAAPLWAQLFNTSFSAIDGHTHVPGQGLPVDSTTITFINDFALSGPISCCHVNFAGTSITEVSSLFTGIRELFAVDGLGTQIQLTSAGQVNGVTDSGGGFSGDYISSAAQVTYTLVSNTYAFLGPAGAAPANIICGNINNIVSLTLGPVANITTVNITTPNITLNFAPASSATRFVMQQSSTIGQIATLAPYLQSDAGINLVINRMGIFSAFTTGLKYNIFAYNMPTNYVNTDPKYPLYGVLQVANYTTRKNLNVTSDAYHIPTYSEINRNYIPATMGGAQQSVPFFIVPLNTSVLPTPHAYQIIYSDNVSLTSNNLASPTNTFWNQNLSLSILFTQGQATTRPAANWGGP